MDKCHFCGADTQLYYSGIPVCVKCSENVDWKSIDLTEKKPAPPPDREES